MFDGTSDGNHTYFSFLLRWKGKHVKHALPVIHRRRRLGRLLTGGNDPTESPTFPENIISKESYPPTCSLLGTFTDGASSFSLALVGKTRTGNRRRRDVRKD